MEKNFLGGILRSLLLIIIYRVLFHFFQWQKTKVFPHIFFIYLSFLLTAIVGIWIVVTKFQQWQGAIGYILSLAGVLGIYLISSQEIMKREEKF